MPLPAWVQRDWDAWERERRSGPFTIQTKEGHAIGVELGPEFKGIPKLADVDAVVCPQGHRAPVIDNGRRAYCEACNRIYLPGELAR